MLLSSSTFAETNFLFTSFLLLPINICSSNLRNKIYTNSRLHLARFHKIYLNYILTCWCIGEKRGSGRGRRRSMSRSTEGGGCVRLWRGWRRTAAVAAACLARRRRYWKPAVNIRKPNQEILRKYNQLHLKFTCNQILIFQGNQIIIDLGNRTSLTDIDACYAFQDHSILSIRLEVLMMRSTHREDDLYSKS